MTKGDNENFKNSVKCWICDNDYIENDVEVRDHCHITGRYRGSAHRDCKQVEKNAFSNLCLLNESSLLAET